MTETSSDVQRQGQGERVLVTGASGYLGTHVVQQLQSRGYRVRGTVLNIIESVNTLPQSTYPFEKYEADLTKAESWTAAVKDCNYVIHTACITPWKKPKDEQWLLDVSVNGTLNVLRAASQSRTVKRVVLTSSISAIFDLFNHDDTKTYTEANWADETNSKMHYYSKSKTLAERTAWKFVNEIEEVDEKLELSVIHPGYILGPVLGEVPNASSTMAKHILDTAIPLVPDFQMAFIDVRDCAEAHINAMTSPDAAGKRHLLFAEVITYYDVNKLFYNEFKSQGLFTISVRKAPMWFWKVLAKVNEKVKFALPIFGKKLRIESPCVNYLLDHKPIGSRESLIEMARTVMEKNMSKTKL